MRYKLPYSENIYMRLSERQAKEISRQAHQVGGETAHVHLFCSRLDDGAKGDDIDLLLEIPEPASDLAQLVARFAVKVSRLMRGEKRGRFAFCTPSRTFADTRCRPYGEPNEREIVNNGAVCRRDFGNVFKA